MEVRGWRTKKEGMRCRLTGKSEKVIAQVVIERIIAILGWPLNVFLL
jgi:hypothetical protein